MNISDTYEKKMLDLLLVYPTTFTPDVTLYFGLLTGDPTDTGVIISPSAEFAIGTNGYARAVVTNNPTNFPLCSTASTTVTKSNGTVIAFPTNVTAGWGTATHWAVFNAASGGGAAMIAYGPLSSPRTVVVGDTPKLAIGAFSITPSNSASGGFTAYTKRKLLDHVFGAIAYSQVATLYFGLGTALTDDVMTEWNDATYARRVCAFTAAHATAGTCPNTSAIVINGGVSSLIPVTLTHYGIWDDPGSGNLLVTGAVNSSRALAQADTVNLPAGGCIVTVQ